MLGRDEQDYPDRITGFGGGKPLVRPVICHLTRISFPFEVRIQASRSSTFRVGRSDLWLCGCFFGALPELLVVCIYERHCQSYPGARVDRLWTCNARLVPLHGTAKFMPL